MDIYKTNYRLKAIAASIRQKRELRNYTQEYLAFKLDISQNAYSKIELGYTKIPLERLIQISEILECDPVEFLDFKLEVVHKRQAS